MAREFSVEIQRDGINAQLFLHNDGSVEIVNPDSGEQLEYLRVKLTLAKEMAEWMRKYSVIRWECTKI